MRHLPFVFVMAAGACLCGCAQEHTPTQEISTVREATAEEKFAPEMSTAERMRVTAQPEAPFAGDAPFANAAAGAAPAAAGEAPAATQMPEYRWHTPEGWEEAPPTPMRQANLRLTGDPAVELYLTVMPGDGGGLLANLNRWRGQMGQPELTQERMEALPTQMLLNKPARMIELTGDFKGMGGEVKSGYGMLGLALIDDGKAVFVKMTGPQDKVAAQKQNFLAFAQSIASSEDDNAEEHVVMTPAQPAAPEAAAPEAPTPAPATDASAEAKPIPPAEDLEWDVPSGWTEVPGNSMRLANFTAGEGVECYVSLLGGMAGGMVANVNRWYGQMGQQPLTPEAIAALPKVDVLGGPGAYVDIEGDFTGMGSAPQAGYRMLGVVREGTDSTLFVKMTGPKDAIAAQAEAFKAFVASLR